MPEIRPIAALLYDFDKTLCPKDMQEYGFIPKLGMQPQTFWDESNRMAAENGMDRILAYMYKMIRKAGEAGQPIRREDFVALGRDVSFFPGVEDWFGRINAYGEQVGVQVEHYIISSGVKEIIEGSAIADRFKKIYACEFHYNEKGEADWPALAVNYTGKTQFLFRINKGVLDLSEDDKLNQYVPEQERRIPFRNMIYIGDGLTDVPCMKLVKSSGGQSIAVHPAGASLKAADLIRDKRVDYITPADYTEGSELDLLVRMAIQKMAVTHTLIEQHLRHVRSVKGMAVE